MRESHTESERRIHPRYARLLELHGAPSGGGTSARLLANNLSLGGAYCTSDHDFPEMTRLAVRLEIQGGPLELPAVVVRHKKLSAAPDAPRFELALLFTMLTGAQRERLQGFLASLVA